jgi:hypothetical protein
MTLLTPVALLVFNRPEITERLVTRIIQANPPKVLVFADGPRADHPEDIELIRATRNVIAEAPWACEVVLNYSETNLGTKYRPATGLDWVFNLVEQAIFFEDDCLPHESFFRFCDELLERFKNNDRIMMISGNNFFRGKRFNSDSYLFSHYVGIWGWATWRRAWKHYDVELHSWKTLRQTQFLKHLLSSDAEVTLWHNNFERIVSGESVTWDHQWQFACWLRRGLSIMPSVNLVTNVGFGPGAKHYVTIDHRLANVPFQGMRFPLNHPTSIVRNEKADRLIYEQLLSEPKRFGRIKRLIDRYGGIFPR